MLARARVRTLALAPLAAALAALLLAAHARPRKVTDARPEDLLVVDCLLPGQVRSLGERTTYVTRRRPVRTTAQECRIRGGEYTAHDRADLATSLAVWLQPAQAGDPVAQLRVGEIYEKGLGVAPDFAAAAVWYRRAAEGGQGAAMVALGHLHEGGLGVPRDPQEALRWFRRASGLTEGAIALERAAPEAPATPTEEETRLARELAAERAASASLRRSLQEALLQAERAAAEAKELGKEMARARTEDARGFEERLRASQAEAARARREAQGLEARLAEQGARLQALEREREQAAAAEAARVAAGAMAPPSIEVIDPPVTLTRGLHVVAAAAMPERVVVGRVTAPAGLLSFVVNDKETSLDPSGLFRAAVPLAAARTPVRLAAVDRQGKRAALEFELAVAEPPRPAPGPAVPRGLELGRFHALLIANEVYPHLPDLETPLEDARALGRLLQERYGFRVQVLENATRYQTLAALDALRKGLTEKDSLLVYYAGHGEFEPEIQRGYWLPVDAERDTTANWISTATITDQLAVNPARHVLVVADSCYAGALTRSSIARLEAGASPEARAHWLRTVSSKKSRTALTSGGLQPVLDAGGGGHSVFAGALLTVLRENADVLESRRLYLEVSSRVAWSARASGVAQEPEYAPIRFAGHEAGDFLFVPRGDRHQ